MPATKRSTLSAPDLDYELLLSIYFVAIILEELSRVLNPQRAIDDHGISCTSRNAMTMQCYSSLSPGHSRLFNVSMAWGRG